MAPNLTSESLARAIFWGVVNALLATLLLGLVFALIIFWSSLPEASLPLFAALLVLLSSFYGGLRGAARAGCRGLLTGLLVGLLYFLVLLLLAKILNYELALAQSLRSLVLALVAGSLGGAYGVFRG